PGRFSWRSVGLARANAHSGLKPDSPEGRTHDLLLAPQEVNRSNDPEFPANSHVLRAESTAPLPRVRFRSGTTQTHQPTARTKKTCNCRPFRKRLKGLEPSTFCMASSSSGPLRSPEMPANREDIWRPDCRMDSKNY